MLMDDWPLKIGKASLLQINWQKDWLFLFLLFRLVFYIRYIGLGGFPDVKSAAAQDIYYPGRIVAF